MQRTNQVLQTIKAKQTEQTKPSSITYRSSEDVFAFVWRGLQAARFIPKDEMVGGTDYKYWRHQLADLTDAQIKTGYEGSKSYTGYMTLGDFRKLCEAVSHPMHKPYLPEPPKKYLGGDEVKRRIAKMRQELDL